MQPSWLGRFVVVGTLWVALVGCLVAWLPGCRGAGDGVLHVASGGRPNVLLITIDTLRADHLGAYGYGLATSPVIDRLAREGVTFDNAYTPVPTTAPAVASLLTGRYVDATHVRENEAELPVSSYTLGEALAAAGFVTAGFYGNGALAKGFGQGLGVWQPFDAKWAADDAAGGTLAVRWLESAQAPWFLWVHFMDPHGPYTSPPERSASFVYPDTPLLRRELPLSPTNWGFGVIPRYQALPGLTHVGDYVRRYDGEIVGTDIQVGRLLDALEKSGMLDDTLVVLTADHGESLGEDDYFFQHGKVLNEASLRVPLLMRHPALPRGTRVAAPVSLVDLLPTVTAMLGVPLTETVAGIDVRGAIAGKDLPARDLLAYTVTRPETVAIRRDGFKLVGLPRRDGTQRPGFAGLALYAVGDGHEKRVAGGGQAKLIESLEPEMLDLVKRVSRAGASPVDLNAEQRERLRALGYVD
ncbi:sulfatase [Candidatus Binatia bacterium]|nr:sulfatase [Candidatus Binatia bacterium]